MSVGQIEQTELDVDAGGVKMGSVLETIWTDWRVAWGLAVGLAAGLALFMAWLMPRGPITTTEAFISIGAALAVGLVATFLAARRLSIVLTPVVFVTVFELARLGVDGPTVDGIHLGSMYGIIAFLVGRGIHALLALLPMILGGLLGLALAGRLGHQTAPSLGIGGWAGVGVLGVTMAVTCWQLAIPATTAPIAGPEGSPLPGSVAELSTVEIGGHEQSLMVRGRSVDNPVLLYLAGGPGGTDLGAMRGDVGLEEDFVVVTWDQRGVGKSYSALDPTSTLTVDQMVDDTIELTEHLRQRFDEERIFLVGNSWGSALAVLAAQQHPELYHALVGSGQMVSMRETDIMFWEDTRAWAVETGDTDLVASLDAVGRPPYENLLDYELALSHEHDWNSYPGLDTGNEMPATLFVPEYTWMERFNGFRSFLDTFSVLYPQLQELDLRVDVPSLQVPVYMVLGEHEARGRAVLAQEWFSLLDAPVKEQVVFDGAGHRAHFDQPGRFADLMREVGERALFDSESASAPTP